jgi:hypothetical protein
VSLLIRHMETDYSEGDADIRICVRNAANEIVFDNKRLKRWGFHGERPATLTSIKYALICGDAAASTKDFISCTFTIVVIHPI